MKTTVAPNPSFVPTIKSINVPVDAITYAPSTRDEPATISADGANFASTGRFRDSMLGLIGQSHSIFRLFSPEEVFTQFRKVNGSKMVNVNYEVETGRAISLTNGNKSIMDFDHLREEVIGGAPVTYRDGVVHAMLEPFRTEGFVINNDAFLPRLSLQIPLDSYGSSQSFLAMLRQICSNGMVAMSTAFRHTIAVGDGDNPIATIRRFKNSFYDEDGYSDLRNRIEKAGQTAASVSEFSKLLRLTMADSSNFSLGLIGRIEKAVADTQSYYGLSALNAIDEKRARLTPSLLTVYDLVNMSTELSTHVTDNPYVARKLQGLVGDLLSKQFDLEGLESGLTQKGEFTPTFFVEQESIVGVQRSGFGVGHEDIALSA